MSMLPTSPVIDLTTPVTSTQYPTRTFYLNKATGRVVSFVDGQEAMKQAIALALANERFAWQIYSPNYGAELQGLRGQDYGFACSELKRRVQEALLADDRITAVENFAFSRDNLNLYATFTVETIFGSQLASTQVVF